MFELKLLEDWMRDYEEEIFNKLTLTQELVKEWHKAKKEQRIIKVNPYESDKSLCDWVELPIAKNYCSLKISKEWKIVDVEVPTIWNSELKDYNREVIGQVLLSYFNIKGKYYPYIEVKKCNTFRNTSVFDKYNGFTQLLADNECSMSDAKWFDVDRSEEDIRNRAHKEMLAMKKSIESKVEKICGKILTNVEEKCSEIFTKGENNRVAHIWAINAGGYNIQCLHRRVYVKEVK